MSQCRALTSPDVFAVHCQVEDDCIQVGILVLGEDFQPGFHHLYNLDTQQRYTVSITRPSSPQYQARLPYGTSLQHPHPN
jgi:hypothetical protein